MLTKSWPLFRAFGVDVRVYWTILVAPLIICALLAQYGGVGPAAAIPLGLALTVGIYACVYTHEMAHIVAGRKYGVDTKLITLSPLGGLAHMDSGAPNPRAEMVISLAGPASHLAWLLLLAPAYLLLREFGNDSLWFRGVELFCELQIMFMLFNLLPFYPLDGGRTLRGYFATRVHANKASLWAGYTGMGGAVLLLIFGLGLLISAGSEVAGNYSRFSGVLLILIAFTNGLACQHLLQAARFSDGPYEPVEEWKLGGYEEPWREGLAASQKMSKQEEREERRAAEARDRERERREQLNLRIDELLDRINEVGGVEHLSPSERRELAEASELLRKETAG